MAGYNVEKKEDKPKGKSANYEYDPVSTFLFQKIVSDSLYSFPDRWHTDKSF